MTKKIDEEMVIKQNSKEEDKAMENVIKNRSEILFLYDVTNANPNGDPNDENKPRIDEETGINIVTDVRLKRTIRDYLHDFKQQEIFVREIELDDGSIQDAKLRAKDFLKDVDIKKLGTMTLNEQKQLMSSAILKQCIDVRLFGATIPIELKAKKEKKKVTKESEEIETKEQTSSLTFTGPVQFKFGYSLHKVDLQYIKGTGAFASKEGSEQKTFREEYILPYSLIAFYGIINENAAVYTGLNEMDVNLLIEAIWKGTKNLISRTKAGQMPRLLIRVMYKQNENFHIGELDKLIKLNSDIDDKKIRDVTEFNLDITLLSQKILSYKEKIEKIFYKVDPRLKIKLDGKNISLEQGFIGISCEKINIE